MADAAAATAARPTLIAPRGAQRKTDGQDGPPRSAPTFTATAQNAAAREPAPKPSDEYRFDHENAAHVAILDPDAARIGPGKEATLRKKIAICGFASSTRRYIPVHDPSWEVWTLNQLYRHVPRADRHFDIHHNWDQEVVPGTDERAWARQCGIPFYMLTREVDVPTAVRYPLDRVMAEFEADYFTSTIAYMMALATLEIKEHVAAALAAHVARTPKGQLTQIDKTLKALYAQHSIGLFGIDLTVGGEYFHEKPCAEYWIGVASSLGINVLIPPESALCKQQYRYGYERAPQSLVRPSEVADHRIALQGKRDELFKQMLMLDGAIECDANWEQAMLLRERGSKVSVT